MCLLLFFSSIDIADDETLTRLLPDFFFVFGRFQLLLVFDFFTFSFSLTLSVQISSCESFLVSCQAVTNPLLVGEGGWLVLKDPFRPKVSFQHMPPALASFSEFLVSLSTSRSAL